MQSADKLVMMANQIARNLAVYGEAKAAAGTAEHIAKFWDPRMRAGIAARLAAGGAGLDPVARRAIASLGLPGQAHGEGDKTTGAQNDWLA
ncbi:MAG: formate dehydrogenase subunit delta [Hyphomicrobiaceae bacterium]|nr:formate dehydrogenase subunit delta [Hyphomicrobiaceae bacterium]